MKKSAISLMLIVSILLFSNVFIVPISIPDGVTPTQIDEGLVNRKISSYNTSILRLSITSDEMLDEFAANHSWPGDGSQGDPYIMRGYHIVNDSTNIYITDIHDRWFEIRDCLIEGDTGRTNNGIYSIACYNILIENCTIRGKSDGIQIYTWAYEDGVTINNCTIYDCDEGIRTSHLEGITITNCNIYNCDVAGYSHYYSEQRVRIAGYVANNWIHDMSGSGIRMVRTGGWLLQNNTVDNCGGLSTPGVVIEGMPASDSVMTECTITNCYTGLYVNNSDSIELTDNDVFNNTVSGMSVHYSNDTLIDYNDVYENSEEGLGITYCYDITLEHNNISSNGLDGLYLADSNHTVLINNHFSSNQGDTCEVYAYNSDYTVIVDNDFLTNQFNDGVELYNSDYCNVSGNTISGNTDDGLYLFQADFCVVHENLIENNGDYGIHISNAANNTVTDNTVRYNNRHGIYLFQADNTTIIGNEVGNSVERGVYVYQSDNLYFYDNELHNSGWPYSGNAHSGVHIYDSLFAEVRENRIYNNSEHGIAAFSAHNATFVDNIIYHNWGNDDVGCGIHVQRSDDINIIGNTIYNNTDHGLFLTQSVEGIVSENIIYENTQYGVYLGLQDDSIFDENTLYGNGDSGVRVDMSDNLNMTWNVVYDNTEYGFELVGATNCYLYYNDIGWNDVANSFDDGANHWNSTGIGNWWSDFNETEGLNYNISSIAIDYFPTLNLIAGTATPLSYELGATGNLLTWTAGALNPENYTIHMNDSLDLNTVWNGGSVSFDVDGLDVGHYDYNLTVYHISGFSESATSYVEVSDTTSPQWVIDPQDQVIELGSPFNYQLNATDFSVVNWFVNDTANFAISEGLITNNTVIPWGDYGLNITVIDLYSNPTSYTIRIRVRDTISPFWIVIPQSVNVENGTDINVTFVATDLSGIGGWEVDDDDFEITDGVLTNAVDLAVGVYELTVTVYDNYGNSNSTAFTVTVVEVTATTTPTTPVGPPGVDMIVIIIAAGGAVVVVIILLGVWSKKRGV